MRVIVAFALGFALRAALGYAYQRTHSKPHIHALVLSFAGADEEPGPVGDPYAEQLAEQLRKYAAEQADPRHTGDAPDRRGKRDRLN